MNRTPRECAARGATDIFARPRASADTMQKRPSRRQMSFFQQPARESPP